MTRAPSSLLVTGGAGFFGSAFLRFVLAHDGFDGRVVNLDALTYAANPDNVASIADDPRYRFVHGDVCDGALVSRLCDEAKVEAIVHFAAETHVDRSIHGPEAFVRSNVLGTHTLLEAARARSIHLHHVSTDEVYGSLDAGEVASEQHPYRPSSPYAASKAAADHLVHAYARTYALSTTQTNACNGYGPYQHPEKLIPLMLLAMNAREPLPIYGDGLQERAWLHSDDHAEAVWAAITRGSEGARYNLGGSPPIDNLSLVRRLIAIFAAETDSDAEPLHALIRMVADRPGHDRRYALSDDKARSELGWRPRRTLDEGLRETVRFYLQESDWVRRAQSGEHRRWLELNYGQRD